MGLMGVSDWDWVILLPTVLLAAFSVDGVVSASAVCLISSDLTRGYLNYLYILEYCLAMLE